MNAEDPIGNKGEAYAHPILLLIDLTLRCVQASGKRCGVPAVDERKRVSKPANWGRRFDVGTFGGFPDQAEDMIDLDLMEEATLDLSAGSCRRRCDGERGLP